MKFLVIVQDLRVSGTSEGIVSRSFLAKLRIAYPKAIIDVLYLKHHPSEDDLHLLPVNSINQKIVNTTIPNYIKWINRISRRFFNHLCVENFIHKQYAIEIKKIDYSLYDHIMIRSAGLAHESILAMHNLPILKHSIVCFHDTYPLPWYLGKPDKVTANDTLRLQKIIQVVQQAKACCASAYYTSKDLQFLYASNKFFYTLPHQFDISAFDLTTTAKVRKKERKIQISYHGSLMLSQDVFSVLEAFQEICSESDTIKNNVEFVLRVKGQGISELKNFAVKSDNIWVLDTLNFSNSANEQICESDINLILETGPYYCNLLVGKAAFLASIGKPVFIIAPLRSELRRHTKNNLYIATMHDKKEIKQKLEHLILNRLDSNEAVYPFGDYFSDENFKKMLDKIISEEQIKTLLN